jgi:hypothetical protein
MTGRAIPRSDAPCVHHYLVAAPTGSILLRGRCKKCGAERLFRADGGMEEELAAMRTFGFGNLHRRRPDPHGRVS